MPAPSSSDVAEEEVADTVRSPVTGTPASWRAPTSSSAMASLTLEENSDPDPTESSSRSASDTLTTNATVQV